MKLSVMDYGLIDEASTPQQALEETLKLAKRAESLGYHRFWVAEHHNVPAFAISSPELLVAHLAAKTNRIGLGTGGIMALHYSPFKLAETVATLTTLYPNRMAIGWGNSLSTAVVSKALNSQHSASDFEAVLAQVTAYLTNQEPVLVQPIVGTIKPETFTLGMGGQSAEIAGRLGLGYVLGLFPYLFQEPIALIETTLKRYRDSFVPSVFQAEPYSVLAVFVVIAETEAMAERLARATAVWLLGKDNFREFRFFPSPETAEQYQLTAEDTEKIAKQRERLVVGTPEMVKERLATLMAAGPVDELLVIPLVPGCDNRLKTLEFLSELIS